MTAAPHEADLSAAALAYHAAGLPVVPVDAEKRPTCPQWKPWQSRPQTEAEVRELFSRPAHGLALLTWPASELVVLDFDGPHAAEAWTRTGVSFPETARTRTRSGGAHFIFAMPPATPRPGCETTEREVRRRVRIVKADCPCTDHETGRPRPCGVDLLVSGYFVVPPTPGYTEDPDHPLAPGRLAVIPRAVLDLAATAARSSGDSRRVTTGERIPQGERNAALASLAGTMRKRGMTTDTIAAALLAENAARCDPPLPEAEVRRTAASVGRYPAGGDAVRGDNGGGIQSVPARAVLVRLADVRPERVAWLWPGRIPRGKLTVLIGDPGLGKSFVMGDVTARVTVGADWPDGGAAPQGAVVLLTAEDGLGDTVRPRVDVMGGDAARVAVLAGIRRAGAPDDAPPSAFDIARDLAHLEAAVRETGAVLVIVDPLSAYLGGTDSHNNAEVRGLLAPLAALAERCAVAVVAIMHFNKSAERRALLRVVGSIGFVAAPRAVFAVAPDPEDDGRRLLLPVKLNIAAHPPGLAYRLEPVRHPDGFEVARVVWDSNPVALTADEALAEPERPEERAKWEHAADFLRELLAGGPVEADEVKRQARAAGITGATLRRAQSKLGVQAARVGGLGKDGHWEWGLPKMLKALRGEPLGILGGNEHLSGMASPLPEVDPWDR
jgi:hypothetical protein